MNNAAELGLLLKARDEASGILNNVKGLALGFAAAFVGGAIASAKAAADEEQGIIRMQTAFKNAGVTVTDEWNAALEENIAKMEKSTAFSDGEMRDALSLLVGMTGDAEEGMKRLSFAQDLARGTGMDLTAASKVLGKLTDENVNILKRYGVVVKDGATSTDVLAAVQAKYGGQAEAFGKSSVGQMTNMKNQVDNLVEDIGGIFLPILTAGVGMATDFISALRGGGQLEVIAQIFGTITSIFGELFGVLTGSAPGAGAALTNAIGAGPAQIIMQALAFIRDTAKAIFSGDLPAIFTTFSTRVPAILAALLSFVQAAIPQLMNAVLGWAKEFVAWIGPQIGPMLGELMKLLGSALKWLGDHAEDIGKMLVEWGMKFGEFIFGTAIPTLMEHLPGILLAIGEWVLTEAIPGVIRIFLNLGKGIVSGILEGLGELKTSVWNALVSAFQSIDFWVGPFHVSSGGISVSMPELHFPGFASGTPYVPQTGLALIHKGERIINAQDNARGNYGGGGGGGITIDVHGSVIGITDLEAVVRRVVVDAKRGGAFHGVFAE